MSTKDNTPTGLFSKVAKFVRNPTTNWTDLDKLDPEPEQGYSKQALKEMIERKRQNDFVRKREFDHLRKLRNRDPSAGSPELAGRPSYFQSSLPANPGERAMTIKKIDEIEAQMSNQWWQGKGEASKAGSAPAQPAPAAPAGSVENKSDPAAVAAESGNAYAATKVVPLSDGGYAATRLAPISDTGYAPTKLAPMAAESLTVEQPDFMPTQTNSSFGRIGTGFVNSGSSAGEMAAAVPDAELEEAAIRFANGDHAGAESSLMGALRESGQRRDKADSWTSALFDLYRATGQQARFDNVAIDYAERSGRSAPAWFSIPERLGINDTSTITKTVPSRLGDDPLWSSPRVFERDTIDELQLAIANSPQPWVLNWGALQQLDANACEALAGLFAEWCGSIVSLRFQGAEALDRVLRAMTPSGAKEGGQAPWRLRMDALRLMGLQDEFELVALDYCVTYEVSPPAWQDVRCRFERDAAEGEDSQLTPLASSVSVAAAPAAGEPAPSLGRDAEPAAVVELAGEIVGEATEALERLEAARAGADRLVISCANLIRVDFSAAGSILNWVALRQAEGCHLQFRDVHRLVGAFFHVIGINEYARIVLRST